jgi:hypothetical protein
MKIAKSAEVSITIVKWNTRELLRDCLRYDMHGPEWTVTSG